MFNKKRDYAFGLVAIAMMLIVTACSGSDSTEKHNQDAATAKDNEVEAVEVLNESDLKIEDVWLRPSLEGNPTELNVTFRNEGDEDDSLHDVMSIGVLPLLSSVQFYDGEVADNKVMYQIDIPAGETVVLQPGGYFIQLEDTEKDLNPGDSVRISLYFLCFYV